MSQMASRVVVGDCISSLQDLWDSEEYKINSDISSSLKATYVRWTRFVGKEMKCFNDVLRKA